MRAALRVFVSGGAGMVGRNIAEHPAAAQWQLIAPGRAELDLESYEAVEAFLRETRPDVVIHAAGLVGGIQANIARPVDFLVRNVDMGRNVILAARAAGVGRLINLGSSCMYPRHGSNPLREEQVLDGELEPTNEGYAIAKIYAARLCQYLRREEPALDYKTLLPCNLYGRHDKFDPAHSHLIPAVIRKIHEAKAEGAETVEIWGDGTARREFMYAADLADAVARHVEQGGSAPELMNIGLGHDHTINEYYAAVAKVVGWQGRFVHDLDRPVGMKQKLVDISRQTAWGWAPRHTLEQGIALCYEYFLEKHAR
ncbi:GDP-L-fucose synthase [Pelomonas sp. SE-A7]|uniref:GDP-L-fucose synthase family protein n=1 Tax=Pelomonas sp. SE-A7 TaxID=3054953 RepID=UPI00259C82AB|nr:GDP-L-fucose synthase [Pelomonas sp. SE-A7]MDM4764985.1 GDP-L-fucose synthase [Pelomonas sp. SE-A7]